MRIIITHTSDGAKLNIIITGGSGFIGEHYVNYLIGNNLAEKILILDIIPPQYSYEKVQFILGDIRSKIDIDATGYDLIIHLGALAKEPGYQWDEYFETNHFGTKNVIAFAEKNNINSIIFISTMMVFKAGEKRNKEDDLTAPDTAYGISKLLAEERLLAWSASSTDRKLKIIRPGIVFGKGENGNITRLYKALKRNMFFYVGRKSTIKGSVYVKDVVNFLMFCTNDESLNKIYNLTFPEPDSIENICNTICTTFNWKRYIPVIPYKLVHTISYIFEFFNKIGLKNPVHHRRIEKLYNSTNLSSDLALKSGFHFKYNLKEAFEDWKKECGSDSLY